MFETQYTEQLTFKPGYADALIETLHAQALREIREAVKAAVERINRSTGQHLFHLRMRNEECLERLGFNRGGSRA